MAFFAGLTSRRAYMAHLKGNQLMEEGKIQEAEAKHQEAIALYEESFKKGVKTPGTYLGYGVLQMRRREYEKARESFLQVEKLPNLTPQDKKQMRTDYAICMWKMGKLDIAIEQMKEAQRAYGNDSLIYGSLGYMLIEKAVQTGDFTEAQAFNNEAMEYDDEDAVVLDNMGQLYLNMGDKEKAREYFEKAHEQKPKQVDTLYYLAVLSKDEGNIEKAKEYLDTALNGNFSALCTVTREQAQQLRDELGD